MATELGSYSVDITARIKGYQQEIEKLKRELDKVDIGSSIGKKLTREIESAEKALNNLNKNANQRFSSESQIVRLIDNFHSIENLISQIGKDMQQVKFSDLNADKMAGEIQAITAEVNELKQNLNQVTAASFSEVIDRFVNSSSGKFKTLMDSLQIDPKALNYDNWREVLDGAINQSKAKVDEYKTQIADLNTQLKELNTTATAMNKVGGIDPTALVTAKLGKFIGGADVQSISQPLTEQFKLSLTDSLVNGVKDLDAKQIQDIVSQEFARLFTSDATINSVNAGLNNLRTRIAAEIKKQSGRAAFSQEDLKKAIGLDQYEKLSNVETYIQVDEKRLTQFNTAIQQLADKQNNFGLNDNQLATFLERVNATFREGNPDEAIKMVAQALSDYVTQCKQAGEAASTSATEIKQQIESINAQVKAEQNTQQSTRAYENILQANASAIQAKVADQEQRIANLEAQLANKTSDALNRIHGTGVGVQESAAQYWQETNALAQQYTAQLDQVKQKEQLVGKIEGVVQRWFSIYAAVRMVQNAINSVKQTLQELDKTITEIAIVTDMSQSDLWAQMDSYTKMARQYATSISGVYTVSQLFYQQGLQTADVLKLPEETLKMARISGLDYATATDYMTNAIRSFKMEMSDAQTVVDVYSAIAASSATSTTELATAMSKTASSAEAVGSSFENTTAMMAVMIESTRESAENIGSAMKSIISRYGELKTNPTTLIDSEGEALSLNNVDKALKSVGITLQDVNGQFRDFDEVIMELSKAWNTIDVNTQRYIATVMAGNRLNMLAVA